MDSCLQLAGMTEGATAYPLSVIADIPNHATITLIFNDDYMNIVIKAVSSLTKGEDNEESTCIYVDVSLSYEFVAHSLWWGRG